MARRVAVLPAAVGVVVAAGLIGSASAGAEPGAPVPASVFPAQIHIPRRGFPANGHRFNFEVMLDICPTPLLEPDHATIVERPRVGTHKGAAIVTAYVRWPEHNELLEGEPCPPLPPITEAISVRTKRPASELIFFDGSSSPPRRVYPLGRQRRYVEPLAIPR